MKAYKLINRYANSDLLKVKPLVHDVEAVITEEKFHFLKTYIFSTLCVTKVYLLPNRNAHKI